jgi:CheY-like chemotaxis protein
MEMKEISVLIVEDSIYSADLNIREIKKVGYDVSYQIISSGQSMKTAISKCQWDLIISDNSMPNFSALKALEIRNEANGDIPFIIVSEDISTSDIDKAFQEGCTAFVAKEKLTELRNMVIKVLENGSTGIKIGI